MTQKDMILVQTTVEDTDEMLENICTFRLRGGCGSSIKNHCFEMSMKDRCYKCHLSMITEEHKKQLLQQ